MKKSIILAIVPLWLMTVMVYFHTRWYLGEAKLGSTYRVVKADVERGRWPFRGQEMAQDMAWLVDEVQAVKRGC